MTAMAPASGFNVDNVLNFEKRSGIKTGEIDDFIRKVDAVNEAISKMKDGTLAPEDVHVEGVPTENELAAEAAKKAAAKADMLRRAEESAARKKAEERERWWKGAELLYGVRAESNGAAPGSDAAAAAASTVESAAGVDSSISADEKQRLTDRYSAEYSRWDTWTPNDPATREEDAVKQAEEDKVKNAQFEASNPDFCKEFSDDMKKRESLREKKEASANAHKLKGNRYFKAKQYGRALELYMLSLKDAGYECSVLGNVAMAYTKLQQWTDAIEFCNRALHVSPSSVKALSRRATARVALGDKTTALQDLALAVSIDPDNADLQKQYTELQLDVKDEQAEAQVMSIARPQPLPQPAAAATVNIITDVTADVEDSTVAPATSSATAATAAAAAAAAAAAPLSEFTLIDELMAAAQSQFDQRLPKQGPSAGDSPLALQQLRPLLLLSAALSSIDAARVYLRSSGLLAALIAMVVSLASSSDGDADRSADCSADCSAEQRNLPQSFLEDALCALTEAVRGERRSQLAAYKGGAVAAATLLLSAYSRSSSSSSGAAITAEAAAAAVQLVQACAAADDVKRGASADCALFSGVLHVIASKSAPRKGVLAGAELLRECLIAAPAAAAAAASTVAGVVAAAVPEAVGTVCAALSRALPKGKQPIPADQQELIAVLCGAAANLAMHEALRPRFGTAPGAAAALVRVIEHPRVALGAQSLALAALMNACHGAAAGAATRAAAHSTGATAYALAALSSSSSNSSSSAAAALVRSRQAGLLARLSADPAALSLLCKLPSVAVISDALVRSAALGGDLSSDSPSTGAAERTTAVREERDQLVRVLSTVARAAAVTDDATGRGESLAEYLAASGAVAALLSFLPPARRAGVSEPANRDTVGLVPIWRAPKSLAGNVCGTLLHLVSCDAVVAAVAAGVSGDGGIERLLCLFANSEDGPVRKNAAICVARLAKRPALKERIQELRGMEMLVQAGRALV